MNKTVLERWLHLNMAMIGGFMGGYAILNHHDLFGSAQTANMISLAMDAAGHEDGSCFLRIAGLLIYILGLSSTVIISHKLKPSSQKKLSLAIDGLVLLGMGFFPDDLNIFVATFPIFFATAFQWCTFKGAEGFTSSSIFSTNNLRQCVTGYTEYFYSHDNEALRRGKFFGKVLLSFHIGVAVSFLSCRLLDIKGSWIGLMFILSGYAICYNLESIMEPEKPVVCTDKVINLNISQQKIS